MKQENARSFQILHFYFLLPMISSRKRFKLPKPFFFIQTPQNPVFLFLKSKKMGEIYPTEIKLNPELRFFSKNTTQIGKNRNNFKK